MSVDTSKVPEHIWAGRWLHGGRAWREAAIPPHIATEYVRADLYAALLAERDALIHDIERAKASESALLAELEQARGEALGQAHNDYERGQAHMRDRLASGFFLRRLIQKQSCGEWDEETIENDLKMYTDAILSQPILDDRGNTSVREK